MLLPCLDESPCLVTLPSSVRSSTAAEGVSQRWQKGNRTESRGLIKKEALAVWLWFVWVFPEVHSCARERERETVCVLYVVLKPLNYSPNKGAALGEKSKHFNKH